MPASVQGKVVLIVGASSGIGRAAAHLFASQGASVMAAARRIDRLLELRDELRGAGHSIEVHACDAAKTRDMEQLVRTTQSSLGEIDILIYTTGTNTPERALTRLTPEVWDTLVNVNLNGAYYATHAVLPSMRKARSGYLMYVSSISGLIADASGAAYQASKRGLLGLAHAIRFEEKENGIRTCVICPGLVDTEILAHRPVKPTADVLQHALQPEDVAEAILAVAKLPLRAVVPEMQILPTYL
jgi:serine 3-dehydrogenase (NADP+)